MSTVIVIPFRRHNVSSVNSRRLFSRLSAEIQYRQLTVCRSSFGFKVIPRGLKVLKYPMVPTFSGAFMNALRVKSPVLFQTVKGW